MFAISWFPLLFYTGHPQNMFIYSIKSNSPIIDPCGTLHVTFSVQNFILNDVFVISWFPLLFYTGHPQNMFIYSIKSNSPIMDPCGTLHVTFSVQNFILNDVFVIFWFPPLLCPLQVVEVVILRTC